VEKLASPLVGDEHGELPSVLRQALLNVLEQEDARKGAHGPVVRMEGEGHGHGRLALPERGELYEEHFRGTRFVELHGLPAQGHDEGRELGLLGGGDALPGRDELAPLGILVAQQERVVRKVAPQDAPLEEPLEVGLVLGVVRVHLEGARQILQVALVGLHEILDVAGRGDGGLELALPQGLLDEVAAGVDGFPRIGHQGDDHEEHEEHGEDPKEPDTHLFNSLGTCQGTPPTPTRG
jgi:hypothetical protein